MANRERNSNREKFWRDMLTRFKASGLSVRTFCQQEQLSEPSFYGWRQTIRLRDEHRDVALNQPLSSQPLSSRSAKRRRKPAAFVPVVVDQGSVSATAGMSLELRGGRTLRLSDSISIERVTALIRALEAEPAVSTVAPTESQR